MAKFIFVKSTAGEEYIVNTDHIYCLKAEHDKARPDLIVHKVVLPDEVIWVTQPMYNKIKIELREDYGE